MRNTTNGLKRWRTDNGEYRGYTYRGHYIVKSDWTGWEVNTMGADGYFTHITSSDTLDYAKAIINRLVDTNA